MKLGKLLQYRKWQEEKSQRELARRKKFARRELDKLEDLREKKAREDRIFLSGQQEPITSEQLKLYADFMQGISLKCQEQKGEVAKALVQVEEKRTELIRHSQEKRIVEKLKEKQDEELNKKCDRREQQFLDEICLQLRRLLLR
jgi:flagellar FliJ protein